MNAQADIAMHEHKRHKRRDIASGDAMPLAHLIRFVAGPDNTICPDLRGNLPGRGCYIVANRAAIDTAIKRKAFAHAFRTDIVVPENLVTQIETGLTKKVLDLLAMGKKSGQVETGFNRVKSAAATGDLALRFEAADSSEDGRGKIRAAAKAGAHEREELAPVCIGCFSSAELGKVLGREHLVHVGVRKGRIANAVMGEVSRLAGFRVLIPANWPDRAREAEFTPSAECRK